MKFEFDTITTDDNVMAEAYYMEDQEQDICICLKTTQHNVFVWLYPDGDISVQNVGFTDNPIKKFYKGDSITITF